MINLINRNNLSLNNENIFYKYHLIKIYIFPKLGIHYINTNILNYPKNNIIIVISSIKSSFSLNRDFAKTYNSSIASSQFNFS